MFMHFSWHQCRNDLFAIAAFLFIDLSNFYTALLPNNFGQFHKIKKKTLYRKRMYDMMKEHSNNLREQHNIFAVWPTVLGFVDGLPLIKMDLYY